MGITHIAVTRRPNTSTVVLDDSVVVQMLWPKIAVTFVDYFSKICSPYILRFVLILSGMLTPKTSTRQHRGTGIRRRVRPTLTTKIPGNWANLLRVDQTSKSCFSHWPKPR